MKYLLLAVYLAATLTAQTVDPAKTAIEERFLANARGNIETHRKSEGVLAFRNRAGQPLGGVRMKLTQVSQDFLFGALSEEAFSPLWTPAEAERYKRLFLDVFNFTIATVKWQDIEAKQGRPNWARIDQLLDWASAHDVTVKGHTLVWTHPAGTPDWVLALPDDVATRLLEARVRNFVGGFKGRIDMWDVLNEPVTTVPWSWAMREPANTNYEIATGGRYDVSNVSLEDRVPDVAAAYRWAGEANPTGELILNDFFLIAKPEVRKRFQALVSALIARGVPLQGLGIQAHEPRDMWFSPEQTVETFDQLGEFKLPLHVTEFIPQSAGKPIEGWRSGTWTEEAQADFAEQFYTLAFGHPAVSTINWWGFSDRMVWLEGGGLVDAKLEPKPVYRRLKTLIKDTWMTKNVELTTGPDGSATFRGFHGKYRVEVTLPDGRSKELEIHVRRDEANTWQFTSD